MASIGQAKSFWNILKTVTVRPIADAAAQSFAIAVVGEEAACEMVLQALEPGAAVHPSIRSYRSTSEEDGFPQSSGSFDIVIDAGGGRGAEPVRAPIYSISDLGGWDATVERILDEREELLLAMGRRFPGLRDAVSRRVIRETAVANAEFAMLNALPGLFPVLGIILPTAAVGDMVILAKNQAMMLYRLAAIHELPLDVRSRAQDLAPLLGNAFGWRAVAREVLGFVPGGVGLVAKGAVAYAGTVAVGEALRRYYTLGQRPSRSQFARLYREALAGAREVAGEIARRLPQLPGRKSLPPSNDKDKDP